MLASQRCLRKPSGGRFTNKKLSLNILKIDFFILIHLQVTL